MNYEIKHRWNNARLWSGEAESLKAAVEAAVKAKANLSVADLSVADLSVADLRWADLSGADLSGADLSGANLSGANLSRADLSRADLSWADLRWADLSVANLSGADLSGADLSGADLSGAGLSRAGLSGADLSGADLRGADLSAIKSDVWEILSHARPEAPALATALREGRVDGSVYRGECACLVGTLANARGVGEDEMQGIEPDSSRPAESFFWAIKEGDTPETNQVSNLALAWVEEFIASSPLSS